MGKQKKMLIITAGRFPEGDAGALRIKMNCRIFRELNYSVTVICRGNVHEKGTVDGIHYLSLRSEGTAVIKRAWDYVSFYGRVKKFMKRFGQCDCLYLSETPIFLYLFGIRYRRKTGAVLIHDCVEWYSPEEYRIGRLHPEYVTKQIVNRWILNREFRIISISSFLENYFKGKGIPTVRIPMLCDMEIYEPYEKKPGAVLHLFYAGSPGKKDLIGNVVRAISLLNETERRKVRFTVIGCDRKGLRRRLGLTKEECLKTKDVLCIKGRMPREKVLRELSSADFAVLPRDASLRYAKAGFPSKSVEALADSTPLLCNCSSDLQMYLRDGENAILTKSHSPEDIAAGIRRALCLSKEDRQRMSRCAYQTAADCFDYRKYVKSMELFLDSRRKR